MRAAVTTVRVKRLSEEAGIAALEMTTQEGVRRLVLDLADQASVLDLVAPGETSARRAWVGLDLAAPVLDLDLDLRVGVPGFHLQVPAVAIETTTTTMMTVATAAVNETMMTMTTIAGSAGASATGMMMTTRSKQPTDGWGRSAICRPS